MDRALCSDMPRWWASPFEDGTGRWRIHDRDHADKHIATLNHGGGCHWHDRHYWNVNVIEWIKAVERAG